MAKITKEEILEACVQGIERSFNEYLEWSYDEWLWNAPEYLLTVNIAKELWKIKNDAKFITLEDNVRKTLKNADAKIKGSLKVGVRGNGRSDIVFWWGKGTPRGIIEVKNAVYQKKQIQEDLDRIYGILEKKSDIEFGITTFYIDKHFESGNADEKILKRIEEEFIEKIGEEVETKELKIKRKIKKIIAQENDAAYAVTIMIFR